MTTTPTASRQRLALEQITVPANVRDLDAQHVDALAGSIALRGLLVPVIVAPAGDEQFTLVAGFHRFAAHQKLGLTDIDVDIRHADEEHVARGLENITRLQLDPYQEAQAVRAMLADGLTEDGTAQALGWPKARVTARIKLLELPERAQRMVGAGQIALSAVDQLRAIAGVSPALLDALLEFLADGNEWAAERLAREPGWVLDSALRANRSKVFAAHLSQVNSHELAALKLGKKTDALYERAVELAKQLDRYSYGATIRFSDQDVDQARAAGVVVEFDRSAPVIVDRALYRELVRQAIARTVTELEAKIAARAAEQKASRRQSTSQPPDPAADAKRDQRQQLRNLAEQAHGVNLDLGASLLTGLAVIDPAQDMNLARFMVFALLGSDHDNSPHTQTGERIARLAVSGIRLVIDEFRADVTKTLKDGSRGRLRIDYGDPRKPEQPIAWIWKFLDAAKTPSELYGRCLVVVVAEKYASRLVVPCSQQAPPTRWNSHDDRAEKALTKLAGPHLPASLRQLENAVKRANRGYEHAVTRAIKPSRSARTASPASEPVHSDEHAVVNEDLAGEPRDELVDDEDIDANLADDEDLEPGD
jgi:ParB/RepB/Spo0J family partition protein